MVSSASLFLVAATASAQIAVADAVNGSSVAVLYGNGSAEVDRAFQNVFAHFANEFDYDLYGHAMADFEAGLARYKGSAVFGGVCDRLIAHRCQRSWTPLLAQPSSWMPASCWLR